MPSRTRGLRIRTEDSVHDVSAQRQERKHDADRSHQGVVPAKLRRPAHHARRNKNAQRHRHQKQLADEKRQRRCREKIKNVVQRVRRPRKLPRTEILLPALLVEIGENKKQQEGNNPRDNDRRDFDTVHRVSEDTSGLDRWLSFGGKQLVNAFIPRAQIQQDLSTVCLFDCFLNHGVA